MIQAELVKKIQKRHARKVYSTFHSPLYCADLPSDRVCLSGGGCGHSLQGGHKQSQIHASTVGRLVPKVTNIWNVLQRINSFRKTGSKPERVLFSNSNYAPKISDFWHQKSSNFKRETL